MPVNTREGLLEEELNVRAIWLKLQIERLIDLTPSRPTPYGASGALTDVEEEAMSRF